MKPKLLLPKDLLKRTKDTISKIADLTPESTLDCVAGLYREHPAKDYDREEDGDMLLFQYGVYDWGSGENFEIDFTRQFYREDEILQLRCTLYFPPNVGKRTATRNLWSTNCPTLNDWVRDVANSEGFLLAQSLKPKSYRVELEKQ
ncbi:MAG: hypothetical protein JNM27_21340 [Leptospirales bacterium]|nr:hypothetical protein [Leptospirales bacterium]